MKKKCSICSLRKEEDEFDLKRGKRTPFCSECRRAWVRQHYAENKRYYVEKAKKRNKRVYADLRQKVMEYLLSHPCVDCGESNPIYLEFDHVGDNKTTEISRLVCHYSRWETIEEEIAKCEVRCVKCHRLKTYKAIGWWGFDFLDQV